MSRLLSAISASHTIVEPIGASPVRARRSDAAGRLPAVALTSEGVAMALALHRGPFLSLYFRVPAQQKNPFVRLGRKGCWRPSWFHPLFRAEPFAVSDSNCRLWAASTMRMDANATRAHLPADNGGHPRCLLSARLSSGRSWGPGSRGVFAVAQAGGGSQPMTALRCRCPSATRPASHRCSLSYLGYHIDDQGRKPRGA
jgi:hypothetical protein